MNSENRSKLLQAARVCFTNPNTKVAFFCSSQQSVKDVLSYVDNSEVIWEDVLIKDKTGEILFNNGSSIFVSAPQRIMGIEVHKVIFDEQDSIPYELKQHLRTRERL
jgi:hypothetical protein